MIVILKIQAAIGAWVADKKSILLQRNKMKTENMTTDINQTIIVDEKLLIVLCQIILYLFDNKEKPRPLEISIRPDFANSLWYAIIYHAK